MSSEYNKLQILDEIPELNAWYILANGLRAKLVFIDNNNNFLPFKIRIDYTDGNSDFYWLANGGIDGLEFRTIVEKVK